MKEISDEILMVTVRNGVLDAMETLFDRYHVRLYNFFLQLTFDKETSRDLTQNVFYRVIRYRHTYKEAYPFRTWVYQMARNVFADHYQKNKNRVSDYYQPDQLPDDPHSALDEMERIEKNQELYEAMSRLSPDQQELLVLSRFQGLKYEEISRIQNCSVDSIKVRVHRAIKKLREYYFENV